MDYTSARNTLIGYGFTDLQLSVMTQAEVIAIAARIVNQRGGVPVKIRR